MAQLAVIKCSQIVIKQSFSLKTLKGHLIKRGVLFSKSVIAVLPLFRNIPDYRSSRSEALDIF